MTNKQKAEEITLKIFENGFEFFNKQLRKNYEKDKI